MPTEKRTGTWRGFAAAAVGVVAAAPLVGPSTASAGNFGSGPTNAGPPQNELSLGNNRWHSHSFHNAPTTWRTALNDAIFWSYEPTDLVTSQYTDGWNDVDVRVDVGSWGSGANGYVYCPADAIRSGTDPNESCYRQWLKIDTTYVSGYNADQRKSLMCHEYGHTLGLRHPTSGTHPDVNGTCMRTPNLGSPTGLHQHDIDHLNAQY